MRELKFRAWDKDENEMLYDFGLTQEYIPLIVYDEYDEGTDA